MGLVAADLTWMSRLNTRLVALLIIGALAVGLAFGVLSGPVERGGSGFPGVGAGSGSDTVTVAVGEPATLDPARAGDTSSAVVIAQLFEGLTAFDPGLNVRPALAASWEVLDGGQRIMFHLRPNLSFSDGSPIHGADVVRSWLRIIDPARPSPLASLMTDVVGADDFAAGRITDPAAVGLSASGDDVDVRLRRPAADFPDVIASPTFAVVPARVGTDAAALQAGGFVGSGGYRLTSATSDVLGLTANDHYWAGRPAIGTVRLVIDTHGRSPVDMFSSGDVDYTGIGDYDAAWIAYDAALGPSLRSVPSLGISYYGFNTTQPPFNDSRVRQAFAKAVDWKRLVALAGPSSQVPATSMVPPGIPGHPATDFSPVFDPAAARALLADAGYPGGSGFPTVTLVTDGGNLDESIVAQIRENLGVTLASETMDGQEYFDRLADDVPAFWSLIWNADYPGPNDFLGLLLGTGQSNNYGHWSSPDFDAAIADARSTGDPKAAEAAYERAQAVVQAEDPVIPVSYGTGWALSRPGLLGAGQNGLGVPRMAGLSWSTP